MPKAQRNQPRTVLYAYRGNPSEKLLLQTMVDHSGDDGFIQLTPTQMAARAGVSIKTLQRVMRTFIGEKLVRREAVGRYSLDQTRINTLVAGG